LGRTLRGNKLSMEISASHFETNDGEFSVIFARDITERLRSEEALIQSQRLEAVGQLTGGLAHDFNNLRGIIVGNLDLIELKLSTVGESISKRIKVAREEALRCSDITGSLLAVARRQSLEIRAHDLNKLITEFLTLAHSAVDSEIEFKTESIDQNEEIIVNIDEAGIKNALLNLTLNARDAMESKQSSKTLTLRVRYQQVVLGSKLNLTPGSLRDSGSRRHR